MEAVPEIGEVLGEQTNCYNSGRMVCDLVWAAGWKRFQKSGRKDTSEVAFTCNLEHSGFDPGYPEVKGCCVNPPTSSLA